MKQLIYNSNNKDLSNDHVFGISKIVYDGLRFKYDNDKIVNIGAYFDCLAENGTILSIAIPFAGSNYDYEYYKNFIEDDSMRKITHYSKVYTMTSTFHKLLHQSDFLYENYIYAYSEDAVPFVIYLHESHVYLMSAVIQCLLARNYVHDLSYIYDYMDSDKTFDFTIKYSKFGQIHNVSLVNRFANIVVDVYEKSGTTIRLFISEYISDINQYKKLKKNIKCKPYMNNKNTSFCNEFDICNNDIDSPLGIFIESPILVSYMSNRNNFLNYTVCIGYTSTNKCTVKFSYDGYQKLIDDIIKICLE